MRTNAAKPSSSTNHRGDRRNCLKSHILAFTSTVIVTYHCLGAQLAISVHNCPVLTDSRFPMSIFKRTQRKYVKKAYRVRNWREYEAGLRNRGSLTVWISLTAGKLVNWDAPRPRRRKPGRQRKYGASAIKCCYAAAGSGTGAEETGLRALVSRKTSIRDHKGIVVAKKMSRKVSRRVVRPACIAGVRISRPNFRAPCGRTKL